MSIVRVGLSETKGFSEGYEAIFGKKKSSKKSSSEKKATTAKAKKKSKSKK